MATVAELILHPIRLRIVQALTGSPLSATELKERLADVPTSSVYRHLSLLRGAGFVELDRTRAGKGPKETVYRLAKVTRLTGSDVEGISLGEHKRMFTTWVITLMQRFERYLDRAASEGAIDLMQDRVGYTEVAFHADEAEFDAFATELNLLLGPLLATPEGPGRRRRRLCTVTFPEE
jgi:DNA-binding transcriptional ArsR family regulator